MTSTKLLRRAEATVRPGEGFNSVDSQFNELGDPQSAPLSRERQIIDCYGDLVKILQVPVPHTRKPEGV